jgi:GDP-4-dehydro-6-deoxy-D-mannose reductase
MITLLTGANGFVGKHVAKKIHCVDLVDGDHQIDLRDQGGVARVVSRIKPDRVIHLAAQSFVPESFRDPYETFAVNFTGTLNLLIALKATGFRGRFLYVSSGDVYGAVPNEFLPVSELYQPKPRNPYAVSKLAAEALCYQWGQTEHFEIIVARPFNHVGAGQSDRFVLPKIARQLCAIRRGNSPSVLKLGDIDATRDYCDVGDIVSAYERLLEAGTQGEVYNVCSGIERTVHSCASEMASMLGVEVSFVADPALLRPNQQLRMAGNANKIKEATNWSPVIPWDETLSRLLNFWESAEPAP